MAIDPGQSTLSYARPLVKSTEDETLFESLFLRHYEPLQRILYRLVGDEAEAEDLCQKVFLKLHHALVRLQAQGEPNIAGWLYRVAVNEGYNALRSRKRRLAWYERFARLWPFADALPDPAQAAEVQDTQSQVRRILAKMKPRDAKLLLLRHAGLSYDELATTLDLAPASVGPLLTKAKRDFAQRYRSVFSEEE
jgi:RNA polymerase sigma-70 factor (ECF subfamily)